MRTMLILLAILLTAPLVVAQDPPPAASGTLATTPIPVMEKPAVAVPPASGLETPEIAPVEKTSVWDRLSGLIFGVGWDIFSYLVLAVLTLLGALLGLLSRWIGAKTGSEKAEVAARRLSTALMDAVKATWEVYVKEIKRGRQDGKLTEDEKKSARKMAIGYAKVYLGPRGITLVLESLGIKSEELDGVLGKLLEPYVRRAKDEGKLVEADPRAAP